jgi:hypothetical protein
VTSAAKRKSTAPRKAAAKKGNGSAETNGHSLPPASETELRAPEEFVPTTTPVAAAPEPPKVLHPYGDVPVYIFYPKDVRPGDSLEPIVFPHITTINADVEFFWEMDDLDPMHQSFRYMKKANVPKDIQRRVVRLPDAEMARFIQGWFMGIVTPQGVSPPGES